jgi:hypothetical protein
LANAADGDGTRRPLPITVLSGAPPSSANSARVIRLGSLKKPTTAQPSVSSRTPFVQSTSDGGSAAKSVPRV